MHLVPAGVGDIEVALGVAGRAGGPAAARGQFGHGLGHQAQLGGDRAGRARAGAARQILAQPDLHLAGPGHQGVGQLAVEQEFAQGRPVIALEGPEQRVEGAVQLGRDVAPAAARAAGARRGAQLLGRSPGAVVVALVAGVLGRALIALGEPPVEHIGGAVGLGVVVAQHLAHLAGDVRFVEHHHRRQGRRAVGHLDLEALLAGLGLVGVLARPGHPLEVAEVPLQGPGQRAVAALVAAVDDQGHTVAARHILGGARPTGQVHGQLAHIVDDARHVGGSLGVDQQLDRRVGVLVDRHPGGPQAIGPEHGDQGQARCGQHGARAKLASQSQQPVDQPSGDQQGHHALQQIALGLLALAAHAEAPESHAHGHPGQQGDDGDEPDRGAGARRALGGRGRRLARGADQATDHPGRQQVAGEGHMDHQPGHLLAGPREDDHRRPEPEDRQERVELPGLKRRLKAEG